MQIRWSRLLKFFLTKSGLVQIREGRLLEFVFLQKVGLYKFAGVVCLSLFTKSWLVQLPTHPPTPTHTHTHTHAHTHIHIHIFSILRIDLRIHLRRFCNG